MISKLLPNAALSFRSDKLNVPAISPPSDEQWMDKFNSHLDTFSMLAQLRYSYELGMQLKVYGVGIQGRTLNAR